LFEEIHYQTLDRDLKREAFDFANSMLRDEKKEREEQEQRDRTLDRVNYFPFTHGDLIEKQR